MRFVPLLLLAACARHPAPGPGSETETETATTTATETEPRAPRPKPSPATETKSPPPLTITITEIPSSDSWTVTYTLTTPSPSIIFDRRVPSNRHETWKLPPDLVWDHDPSGDYEIIRSADNAPVSSFTATFPTDTRPVGRVPALNVRFTDGSRLLFTAQVGVYAFACDPRCDRRDRDTSRRWIFQTSATRSLRVLDATSPSTLTWDEPAGDVRGTYVYAGTITASPHDRVTLVADPGLPRWLASETTTLLPELFAFHGAATGVDLDVVPLVLASQTDPTIPGDALRGKSLPQLIQLEAIGKDWARASTERRARWFEVLAHEAFHLWNAQLARRSGEKRDEWLSEGSAVYIAGLALLDAKLLTPRTHEDRIIAAANKCIATLRGPLHAESADASYYACGELVHFLVDRALADRGGVLPIWAKTIAHARTSGSYSTADFLSFIDAPIAADVRTILDVGLGTDPAAFVQRLLDNARLPTKRARGGRMLVRRR